uniref:C2H2-type domain-containing protein n=1 Tax=Lepeophtheirus salmonis TaxID=72036 RepID=A0A0K2TJN8_LEPSM
MVEESCSFCDRLIALLEAYPQESCSLFPQLKKILKDHEHSLLENAHHRVEDFQSIFDIHLVSTEPAHVNCSFCSVTDFVTTHEYLEHLNQHYLDVYRLFKKYYVNNPEDPNENSSPINCPICHSSFVHNVEKGELVASNIRSWVSDHFYDCGEPIRRERIESISKISQESALSSKIIKCGWCEGSFLHRTALKTHMEVCSKQSTSSTNTKEIFKGDCLAKLLIIGKECIECNSFETVLNRKEDVKRRSQFVKHIFNQHPEELDKMDMSYEELCYLSELFEIEDVHVPEVNKEVGDDTKSTKNPTHISISDPKEDSSSTCSDSTFYTCILCQDEESIFSNTLNLKTHYAKIHFKSELIPSEMTTFPSDCPEPYCSATIKDEAGAVLHFGISHSLLSTIMLNSNDSRIQNEALVLFLKRLQSKSSINSSTQRYECPICSHTSGTIFGRLRHLCIHFKIELMKMAPCNKKFMCSFDNKGTPCNFLSKSPFGHVVHVGVTHKLLEPILDSKGFSFKDLRKRHDQISEQCIVCKEIFASKENRLLHTCNSIFEKESQISVGSRKKIPKSEEGTYNLDEFLSDISEGEDVASHFQCTEPSCELFFPTQDSLAQHFDKTSHRVNYSNPDSK